ncbi:cytoplasmic dynein light chain [Cavenderia fasciculata]|uniref:Cytoplasmic dynein light chain n=1 Tax=Cavenderia fasciculata TaxID=261658 RepID=F4PGF2_CACFS|nr:cytoplasmic dynein light chain [Cavenderia fasciculata]EGG24786.1 cytoplasmic dynein light chain [Cavenderia fasciculata]|eukprot:XP_004362637.1 cytoplasmic dynein light chain [Cavenderia fasciculata]
MSTDSEIQETFNRIQSQHKGVKGILIVNKFGSILKSTFDNESNTQYSKLILDLYPRLDSLLKVNDPRDELSFFRVRSKDNDIMISPVVNQIQQ